MIYLTALALVLIAHIAYILLSMKHQQILIDKLMAKDYTEYKREERADEMQQAQIEIDKEFPPAVEPKRDHDYL